MNPSDTYMRRTAIGEVCVGSKLAINRRKLLNLTTILRVVGRCSSTGVTAQM